MILTLILSLINKALGLFRAKTEVEVAHDQGVAQGKAETGRDAAVGELNDIAKADAARGAVRDDDADGILSDPANRGAAKPQ